MNLPDTSFLESRNKEYKIRRIINYGTTRKPRDGRDPATYVSVQLYDSTKGKKHIGSRAIPTIVFTTFNTSGATVLKMIEECKDENGDMKDNQSNGWSSAKLDEITIEGAFLHVKVPPYYQTYVDQDGSTQHRQYPKGHKDQSKSMIADTLTVFVFPDDFTNLQGLVNQQLNRVDMVDTGQLEANHYQNFTAQEILKRAKAEDNDADEEEASATFETQ